MKSEPSLTQLCPSSPSHILIVVPLSVLTASLHMPFFSLKRWARRWRICGKPFPSTHYNWITIYIPSEFSYTSPNISILQSDLSPVNCIRYYFGYHFLGVIFFFFNRDFSNERLFPHSLWQCAIRSLFTPTHTQTPKHIRAEFACSLEYQTINGGLEIQADYSWKL